jgi:hypothetical protein
MKAAGTHDRVSESGQSRGCHTDLSSATKGHPEEQRGTVVLISTSKGREEPINNTMFPRSVPFNSTIRTGSMHEDADSLLTKVTTIASKGFLPFTVSTALIY